MGSSRCGGMALYLMGVLLIVALFASSAKCRPEPPLDDGKQERGSNGNAMAAAVNVNGSSSFGDVKLTWCIEKNCVYEGIGNAPCFCCAAIKPNPCFETRDKCRANCV